jgi:hypothetical protein
LELNHNSGGVSRQKPCVVAQGVPLALIFRKESMMLVTGIVNQAFDSPPPTGSIGSVILAESDIHSRLQANPHNACRFPAEMPQFHDIGLTLDLNCGQLLMFKM